MNKQSVQYTSHFSIHSMQAMAICSRMVLVALTVKYQEYLKAGPFDVHLIINASLRGGIVTVQQG